MKKLLLISILPVLIISTAFSQLKQKTVPVVKQNVIIKTPPVPPLPPPPITTILIQ